MIGIQIDPLKWFAREFVESLSKFMIHVTNSNSIMAKAYANMIENKEKSTQKRMCRMLVYEMPTDYNSINVSNKFDLDNELTNTHNERRTNSQTQKQ